MERDVAVVQLNQTQIAAAATTTYSSTKETCSLLLVVLLVVMDRLTREQKKDLSRRLEVVPLDIGLIAGLKISYLHGHVTFGNGRESAAAAFSLLTGRIVSSGIVGIESDMREVVID